MTETADTEPKYDSVKSLRLRRWLAKTALVFSGLLPGELMATNIAEAHSPAAAGRIAEKSQSKEAVDNRNVSPETVEALTSAVRPVLIGSRERQDFDAPGSTAMLIKYDGVVYGLSDAHGINGLTADFDGWQTGNLDTPRPLDFYNPAVEDIALGDRNLPLDERYKFPEYFVTGCVVAPHLDVALFKLQSNPKVINRETQVLDFTHQAELAKQLKLKTRVVLSGFPQSHDFSQQTAIGDYEGIADNKQWVLIYHRLGPGISGAGFAADVRGGRYVSAGATEMVDRYKQPHLWLKYQDELKLNPSEGKELVGFPILGDELPSMVKAFGHSAFKNSTG